MAIIRLARSGGCSTMHNGKVRLFHGFKSSALSRSYSSIRRPMTVPSPSCSRNLSHSSSLPSIRWASTSTTAGSINVPVTAAVDSSGTEWATPFDELSHPLMHIEPHIGYLKELGLDFGWGPTATVQWAFEHFQCTADLPAWAAVIGVVGLTRLLLLPLFIQASDQSARIAILSPILTPTRQKMTEARAKNDVRAMQQAQLEVKQIYQKAEIKPFRAFLPMLVQVPLGFGLFRLTRGMAELPVPGLETAGFGWITDLTVGDPYYIVPAATSALLWYTFKKGGEGSEQAMQNPGMRKLLEKVIPSVSFAVSAFLPGITQIGFAAGAVWGGFQAYLFREPKVREFVNIHPLPDRTIAPKKGEVMYTGTLKRQEESGPAEGETANSKPGFMQTLKDSGSSVMKQAREIQAGGNKTHSRLSQSELKSAQAYEARRRKEDQAAEAKRQAEERQKRLKRLSRS